MAATGPLRAKWPRPRSQNGVSLSLPRVTSTTKCVSCERRLDCQRLNTYCVSTTTAVPKPGHTDLSSQRNPPHPLVPGPAHLLAQEARQGLILISLAIKNDIRGGLKIVVGDYGGQKRDPPFSCIIERLHVTIQSIGLCIAGLCIQTGRLYIIKMWLF